MYVAGLPITESLLDHFLEEGRTEPKRRKQSKKGPKRKARLKQHKKGKPTQ